MIVQIVESRQSPVDDHALDRQYRPMNSDALNSMMCTMTANGESWES
ncbi:hypothetical protein [Burkholderia lata]|nr:hypothetical protein [Burkholderia lata]